MSVKEFVHQCDKLFKDLGVRKVLIRKKFEFEKIQKAAFKVELTTIFKDLNALIVLFFNGVNPDDI